jgi:hypothetical protein
MGCLLEQVPEFDEKVIDIDALGNVVPEASG